MAAVFEVAVIAGFPSLVALSEASEVLAFLIPQAFLAQALALEIVVSEVDAHVACMFALQERLFAYL
jgi:hypothetical protein